MANLGKSKLAKTTAVTAEAKVTGKRKGATKKAATVSSVQAAVTETVTAQPTEKKASSKLIEAIEKRKKAQAAKGSPFARPPGRRGRRPKAMVEYTPEHQEEDGYVMEPENESLEYDTGIRLKSSADERGYNLDVDYDEELNFDY